MNRAQSGLAIIFSLAAYSCGQAMTGSSQPIVGAAPQTATCASNKKAVPKFVERGEDWACFAENPGNFAGDPEVAFFMGNHDGIRQALGMETTEFLLLLAQGMKAAGVARKRKVCVYYGTAFNLRKVAKNPNLERVVWIGHGIAGTLVEVGTRFLIYPETVGAFASTQIKRVTFMACQAGRLEPGWRELFANSPSVKFDLSNENILVNKAAEELLTSYLDRLVSCED